MKQLQVGDVGETDEMMGLCEPVILIFLFWELK